jgi:hypothetical protein
MCLDYVKIISYCLIAELFGNSSFCISFLPLGVFRVRRCLCAMLFFLLFLVFATLGL